MGSCASKDEQQSNVDLTSTVSVRPVSIMIHSSSSSSGTTELVDVPYGSINSNIDKKVNRASTQYSSLPNAKRASTHIKKEIKVSKSTNNSPNSTDKMSNSANNDENDEIIFRKNLAGKRFEVKDDRYYNLDTEEYVEAPKGVECTDEKNRVCGSAVCVDYFYWRNATHTFDDSLVGMDVSKWIKDITPATVINVVDGDTLDVAVYIPLSRIPGIMGNVGNGGFMTKLRIRLGHVDVAEHNTAQGVFAIGLVNDLMNKCNKEIRLKFWKKEKFGRDMAEVFFGRENTNLAEFLIGYRHPVYGEIAYAYEGKAKRAFPVFPMPTSIQSNSTS